MLFWGTVSYEVVLIVKFFSAERQDGGRPRCCILSESIRGIIKVSNEAVIFLMRVGLINAIYNKLPITSAYNHEHPEFGFLMTLDTRACS